MPLRSVRIHCAAVVEEELTPLTSDVNLLAMPSEAVRHASGCRTDVKLPAGARMFLEQEVSAYSEVMSVFVPKFQTAVYSSKSEG